VNKQCSSRTRTRAETRRSPLDRRGLIAVASSNRRNVLGAITIVNARAALNGSPSLIAEIPAGLFPRELAIEPDGTTLLATNFASGELEAVDLQHLG
jgi:DNA-binding beta-propeller fold protein YncE